MGVSSQRPSDRKPSLQHGARIAPMARLPVFFNLEGRRVVIGGASEAACWKAELAGACGANVAVYLGKETACEALQRLAETHSHISIIASGWTSEDLKDCALAIADCADDDDARKVFQEARRLGVACNIIDRPEFCDFQFGSIVNRSPVVVAISTDGTAPILAQTIRQRIETMLPLALRDWASLARRMRAQVAARLSPGPARRRFWETFSERALSCREGPDVHDEALLMQAMGRCAHAAGPSGGTLSTVGTCPCGADMLTLGALRNLQRADVVVYDGGVSADVLELCRREAERIVISNAMRVDQVQDMVDTLIGDGKQVVRLIADIVSACACTRDIERSPFHLTSDSVSHSRRPSLARSRRGDEALKDFGPDVVEVIAPGAQSSLQELPGRLGLWHVGVPPSGPMDDYSFRHANRLIGNAGSAGFVASSA